VTERQLYLDGRGCFSPIREVEAETELPKPSCSDSDWGIEVSSILSAEETMRGNVKETDALADGVASEADYLGSHRGQSNDIHVSTIEVDVPTDPILTMEVVAEDSCILLPGELKCKQVQET
jgi:hypothetical protein